MGLQVSAEVATQASTIGEWLFVSTAALSLGAVAQWARRSDDAEQRRSRRFLAKLLTFAAVASLLAGVVCLAISRRSNLHCCAYTEPG